VFFFIQMHKKLKAIPQTHAFPSLSINCLASWILSFNKSGSYKNSKISWISNTSKSINIPVIFGAKVSPTFSLIAGNNNSPKMFLYLSLSKALNSSHFSYKFFTEIVGPVALPNAPVPYYTPPTVIMFCFNYSFSTLYYFIASCYIIYLAY